MRPIALFLGCIAPLRMPGIVSSTRLVLDHFDVPWMEMKGASCCPAPGVVGSFDLITWLTVAARNITLAEELQADITTVCNGCYGTLQEASTTLANEDVRRDVNERLEEIGREVRGTARVYHLVETLHDTVGLERITKASPGLEGLKVAVHHGCHFLRPRRTRDHGSSERATILTDIVRACGAEPVQWSEAHTCCGAGGGVRAGRPSTALRITATKLRSAHEAGADVIVNPCSFCHLQLVRGQEELQESHGLDISIPVLHVAQLVGLAVGLDRSRLGIEGPSLPEGVPRRG